MAFDGILILYPENLFTRKGDIWAWAERVTTTFEKYAEAAAPMRSGDLKRSIYGNVDRVGPTELGMQVGATADHAIHVLGGTPAQDIYDSVMMWNEAGMTKQGLGQRSPVAQSTFGRKSGGVSLVPYYKFTYNKKGVRNWIEGSPQQNFLATAYHRTSAIYRSIGGWSGIDDFFDYG